MRNREGRYEHGKECKGGSVWSVGDGEGEYMVVGWEEGKQMMDVVGQREEGGGGQARGRGGEWSVVGWEGCIGGQEGQR